MKTARSTLMVAWISTFVIGMLSGALGPLLPQLAAQLGVRVETLGSMFTALFVGALATQFAGGWLNERVGLRNMAMIGTALLTAGIVGIAISPMLPLVLVCACIAGAGQGALDISTNVLIAAVFAKEKVVSAVNVLHFAFGAGAVVAPVVASASLQQWSTPMPALWLAAAFGAGNLLLGARVLMNPSAAQPASGESTGNGLYRRPELWSLGVLMFLYVGIEIGLGGWTTVYMARTTTMAAGSIAVVVSGYWLALTAGRLFGAALGARISSGALALVSVVGSCVGAVLLLASSGNIVWTIAGVLVMGVSFGPIFPTVVVVATEMFRSAPSRAVSVVISMSSIGGMLLPPLQGILLERISPLASILQVTLCAFIMLALLLIVRRRTVTSSAPASA